jgi:Rhodopirellula transposase DDE domain
LKIHAELDTGCYPTGIKVTDQELQDVAREPAVFHGAWNYTLTPRTRQN